jgi:hypothetical protein
VYWTVFRIRTFCVGRTRIQELLNFDPIQIQIQIRIKTKVFYDKIIEKDLIDLFTAMYVFLTLYKDQAPGEDSSPTESFSRMK